MSDVTLIAVPYHLGRKDVGLGKGVPVLVEALGGGGVSVEYQAAFMNEVSASMGVIRELAGRVRETVAAGSFPFVVAGNCNSSLGTVAGLGRRRRRRLVRRACRLQHAGHDRERFLRRIRPRDAPRRRLAEASSLEGLRLIPEEHVVLAGARDIDAGAGATRRIRCRRP